MFLVKQWGSNRKKMTITSLSNDSIFAGTHVSKIFVITTTTIFNIECYFFLDNATSFT